MIGHRRIIAFDQKNKHQAKRSLLWCFVYVLSIREALKLPINWILTELFEYCGVRDTLHDSLHSTIVGMERVAPCVYLEEHGSRGIRNF